MYKRQLFHTFHVVLARDDCRMAVGGSETCAFVIIYPPFEGVRSPVSYTHLDVYKRQPPHRAGDARRLRGACPIHLRQSRL